MQRTEIQENQSAREHIKGNWIIADPLLVFIFLLFQTQTYFLYFNLGYGVTMSLTVSLMFPINHKYLLLHTILHIISPWISENSLQITFAFPLLLL